MACNARVTGFGIIYNRTIIENSSIINYISITDNGGFIGNDSCAEKNNIVNFTLVVSQQLLAAVERYIVFVFSLLVFIRNDRCSGLCGLRLAGRSLLRRWPITRWVYGSWFLLVEAWSGKNKTTKCSYMLRKRRAKELSVLSRNNSGAKHMQHCCNIVRKVLGKRSGFRCYSKDNEM